MSVVKLPVISIIVLERLSSKQETGIGMKSRTIKFTPTFCYLNGNFMANK